MSAASDGSLDNTSLIARCTYGLQTPLDAQSMISAGLIHLPIPAAFPFRWQTEAATDKFDRRYHIRTYCGLRLGTYCGLRPRQFITHVGPQSKVLKPDI